MLLGIESHMAFSFQGLRVINDAKFI